jgi:hypothetical protein
MVAALQRVLILPVSGQPPMQKVEFVPLRRVQSVRHRARLVSDPF